MLSMLGPLLIVTGGLGAFLALCWLAAAGSDNDGGPDPGLAYVFGLYYIAIRVFKALLDDPMSVLPAFGILAVSAGLIWLGVSML